MDTINRLDRRLAYGALLALAFGGGFAAADANAQGERPAPHIAAPHMNAPRMEMQREPRGYMRPSRPPELDQRPHTIDRDYLRHNFQARHGYRIGPYHAPPHFVYRRWAYGEILPPVFWAPDYFLADYWLFGLDIPPVGMEWVRYGPDAILVDTTGGEICQVVYGAFL